MRRPSARRRRSWARWSRPRCSSRWGLGSGQDPLSARYRDFALNSLTLAGAAALVTVGAAVALGYFGRLRPGPASSAAAGVARLGYAVPGGVIAVGLLVPFAAFDNAVDAWAREALGVSTGLLLTGSIWLLVAAYTIRFLAAALGAYEGGQATVNPNMDAAARALGQTPLGALRRVHLPILTPSLLTALLIVFVDTMKELPATLIMRPFDYDTLAVQAYRLASDERLDGAARALARDRGGGAPAGAPDLPPGGALAALGRPRLGGRGPWRSVGKRSEGRRRRDPHRPDPITPSRPRRRCAGPRRCCRPPRRGSRRRA